MQITTEDLLHRLTHPSSISPYSSLASLSLLVASLPGTRSSNLPTSSPNNTSINPPLKVSTEPIARPSAPIPQDDTPGPGVADPIPVSNDLLEDSMPVLSAALSADAPDAGLAWLWYLIHNCSIPSPDAASMILEVRGRCLTRMCY